MATLTAGELANLRAEYQRATPYLSVLPHTAILEAEVNGAHGRGARSLSYNNGTGTAANFALIEAGQTLHVTTTNGLEKVRIKSITGDESSGTITLDENGIVWGAGDAISIIWIYEIWPVPPRITGGVFYKFYDVVYSNQNSQPDPVAILGCHQAGFLSGGSLILSVPVGDSYAVASGAAITTKVVTVAPSAGVTVGAEAGGSIPITYTTAGTYWVKAVVTDDNGKSQTTYRVHFVYDASNMPYTDFTITGLSGSWGTGGFRFTINATGDVTQADFPDGTLAVLWYVNKYDTTEAYVNLWDTGDNIISAGYIQADNDQDDYTSGAGQVEFQVVTPEAFLGSIDEFGKVTLEAVSSPSKWYEYASWLTVGRAIHHLLRWHSTALACVDVYGLTDNTDGAQNVNFTEAGILQQINSMADGRGIGAKMVSDRLGRLHLVEDSQLLNTAGRAALDTVFTLANADISGGINVTRNEEKRVTSTDADGFSFDGATGTPHIVAVPGYPTAIVLGEFRGVGNQANKYQVFANLTDAKEFVGRRHAAANNLYNEVRITLRGNYLGAFDIVPSIGFYVWGIADADLVRQLGLNGANLICRDASHSIDTTTGVIQTNIVLEPEAFGPDGIDISQGGGGLYPTAYPSTPSPPAPSWTLSAVTSTSPVTIDVGTRRFRYISLSEPYSTTGLFLLSENTSGGAGFYSYTGRLSDTPDWTELVQPYTAAGISEVSIDLITGVEKGISWFSATAPRAQVVYDAGAALAGGAIATYGGTSPYDSLDVATLTSTIAVAVVREDTGGSVNALAIPLAVTESTNSVSIGSTINMHGSVRDCFLMSICRLSDTLVAVVYADNGNSGYPTAVVISESAGSLTAGTPAALGSEAMYAPGAPNDLPKKRIVLVDSGTFVAAYGRDTTGDCQIVACDFTGSTIDTVGTPLTVKAGYQLLAIDSYDTNKIIAAYAASGSILLQTFTVNGTTITADGNEGAVPDMTGITAQYMAIKALTTTKAIIVFNKDNVDDPYAIIATIPS